jgi:hypothetical protein
LTLVRVAVLVPESMTVHLNREGPQSIAAPQAFEATGAFSVYLQNHGTPLHAHVSLDASLSEVARVVTPNRYVEEGATRRVRIDVEDGARPIEGRLKVVTGYGARTEYVTVTLRDPETVEPDVAVDEELGRPPASPRTRSEGDPERLMLAGLLAIALLLAVVTILLVEELLAVVGVLAVLAGVVIAGYLFLE